MNLRATLLAATLAMATPLHAQMVTGADPEQLRTLLQTWGHGPGDFIRENGVVMLPAEFDGVRTILAFGRCTDGRGCQYLTLIALYNNVRNPPSAWINEQNNDYDFVTLSGDGGVLRVRATVVLGTDGMPQSTLRAALAEWVTSNVEIGQRAAERGLARN